MKWVSNFTHNIGKKLDSYLENYNNSLVVRDFNSKIIEISMHKFSITIINSVLQYLQFA